MTSTTTTTFTAGITHQVYGGLPAPTYLIDSGGLVAFYNLWTHVPTLHEAIEALLQQGARGVVKGGGDRLPHPLASVTDGWRALGRGWPQSVIDLETAAPGVASSIWLGSHMLTQWPCCRLRKGPPAAASLEATLAGPVGSRRRR